MSNGQQSDPGRGNDWPVRICGGVGAGAGMALSWLIMYLAGQSGFWRGLVGSMVGVFAGMVLGRLAGASLFRRPPGNGPRA